MAFIFKVYTVQIWGLLSVITETSPFSPCKKSGHAMTLSAMSSSMLYSREIFACEKELFHIFTLERNLKLIINKFNYVFKIEINIQDLCRDIKIGSVSGQF